jgi:hypothetical protein
MSGPERAARVEQNEAHRDPVNEHVIRETDRYVLVTKSE